jgi:glycosyltransferase involved in cell wall biosynthesis
MIGDINKKDKIKHSNILYTGSISSGKTYEYYVSCDGVVHISRLDACPNVVIEALVAGKPVLCNNAGGTPEIVGSSGVTISIDPTLRFKMFSMGNPDRVDPSVVASGMKELLNKRWDIHRHDLSMEVCAEKYYKYFLETLNPVTS